MQSATTQFTHDHDQNGNELTDTPEDYISIGVQQDGEAAIIDVFSTRVTARTPPSFFYDAYQDAWSESEAAKDLEMYEEGGYTEESARIRDALNVMDAYELDVIAQEQRGAQLLEELGLSGVQIVSCEKAAFSPLKDVRNARDFSRNDPLLPGAYLSFVREVGGIPARRTRYPDGARRKLLLKPTGRHFFRKTALCSWIRTVTLSNSAGGVCRRRTRILWLR